MQSVDAALIEEQGVAFAIVMVNDPKLNSSSKREEAKKSFSSIFPGYPVVLMTQDSKGASRYFGRKDLVKFLASIDPARIPFKKYKVS